MADGQRVFYTGPDGFLLVRDVDLQMSDSPLPWPTTTTNGVVRPLNALANTYYSGTGEWTEPIATQPPTGVVAGMYGDSTHVAQIGVNAKGQVYYAANVPIAGGGGGSGATQFMPVVLGGLVVTLGPEIVAMAWEVPTS